MEPTAPRDWFVGFLIFKDRDSPWWVPVWAFLAAVPITAYLYVEQIITGILLQQPASLLRKGQGHPCSTLYHALLCGILRNQPVCVAI